ncbi:MAG: enoyl-CoA hydratase-related protein [Deltaproteobacteria bacterium]|nr:enoyl-CoA hydratase-related protein [Deltaproteobacteria bacterium]
MPSSQKDPLLLERDGAVVTLTLNAPPHNPIGMAMVDRLEGALEELASDRSARAIILTGAGDRSFSVGADITEFGTAVAKMGLKDFIGQRLRLVDRIENLGKPVVCAIRGACVGGGLELALGCHFRLAAEGARIALPEIELGVVPAWSGTQRLTRTVGRAHALDLMLLAKKIGAEEAYRIGLVHEVCTPEALLDRARALAAELAGKPPLAVAGILKAVIEGGGLPLGEGLALELEALERTSGSKDAQEGIMAFLEKRKPVFRGE